MSKKVKSVHVLYLNVGQLPTEKAEKFMKTTCKKLKKNKQFSKHHSFVCIPTRTGETRFETLYSQ